MIPVALRSMAQRKLRTALTAIAVLLGVAMIAGTYVQTDQIRVPRRELGTKEDQPVRVDPDDRRADGTARLARARGRPRGRPGLSDGLACRAR